MTQQEQLKEFQKRVKFHDSLTFIPLGIAIIVPLAFLFLTFNL